jgi:hypothetical protein
MVHPSQVLSLTHVGASKPDKKAPKREASPVTVSAKLLDWLVAMVSPST